MTTYAYDAARRTITVTQPDGGTWLREYDAGGNCTAVTDPAGRRTRYAYGRNGGLTSVTDPLGITADVRCDAAGLPLSITDALGNRSTCAYDAFGRPVLLVDPEGGVTRTWWTTDGHLSRVIGPEGDEQTWLYDGEGNCLRHTGADGGVTTFEYTHFDLLTGRTGPDGIRHTFEHDASLRLTKVTSPEGLTWTYAYDRAGRLVVEEDFDGRRVTYERDPLGRITRRTNALGETVAYDYDALGRMVGKRVGDTSTVYRRDRAGRLARIAAAGCSVAWERDATGRVIAETVDGRRLSFAYDAAGRRIARTTPAGVRSRYGHDDAGRLTRLEFATRTFSFEHDAAGREIRRHAPNWLTLEQRWSPAGRLTRQTTEIGGRRLQRRVFDYRQDGHLIGVDDQLRGGTRFVLDRAGRVTEVVARGRAESYAYGADGDLTYAAWQGAPSRLAAVGDRVRAGTTLVRAGSVEYVYDGAGRTVRRSVPEGVGGPHGTWHYSWDAEDRLTSVVTPDGTVWRYHYDPLGRRTAKKRLAPDGATVVEETRFTWDGDHLVEETTTVRGSDQTVSVTWEHDGLRPLAQAERRSDAVTHDDIDSRLFAVITDGVGTPTELVGETGEISWAAHRTLWGITGWRTGSTAHTPLRFPGQYHDLESGLHYNYYRYYDPETARYLTLDPLGLEPSPNPFTYPGNPFVWADPLGLSPYPGFFHRMRGWFQNPVQQADERMRAARTPMRLGDLDGIELPDAGDPLKEGRLRGLDDDQLLEAINDPDEVGSVVAIHDGAVMQGNHRIAEALSRMHDPRHPTITPDSEILVLGE